jgi:hypothetical protein
MSTDEIADRLYALPIEEFTKARNDAAAELRKARRRDEADEVKALRKPTAAAAAVNRLVREHRDQVEAYLAAAAALRDAQFAGKGDVTEATKLERETLDRLVDLATSDVRQTLQAAAVDDAAAEELRRGRLERELEPRGFGTLLSHAKPAPAKPKPAEPKPNDRAARARLQQAKAALTSARSQERQARRQWEEAQTIVARAESAVDEAQRELESLSP